MKAFAASAMFLAAATVHAAVPVIGATSIAAGAFHACLVAENVAKCWGSNVAGQLGTGDNNSRLHATDVRALPPSTSVAVGNAHSCALGQDGVVRCWGDNTLGQLGNGTSASGTLPSVVGGLTAVAVSAGGLHTCAITGTGGVKCWGSNSTGQLGDGTFVRRLEPVDVVGIAGAISISAGLEHTCAVLSTGQVRCWGDNSSGQLGDGTTVTKPLPSEVTGLSSSAFAVEAGQSHTCAVVDAGSGSSTIRCWGYNINGQLGDGTTDQRDSPVPVAGLSSARRAPSAGEGHSCAINSMGSAVCWGRNDNGQIGDGTLVERRVPTEILGGPGNINAISSGGSFSCATSSTGAAFCWGGNSNGELGDGTTSPRATPAAVLESDPPVGGRLTLSSSTIDFGAHSMGTASPIQMLTVRNVGDTPVTVAAITSSDGQFIQSNNCMDIPTDGTCDVILAFAPAVAAGPLNSNVQVSGTLTIHSNALGSPHSVTVLGTAEKSLVTHYYRSILRRSPDVSGKAFWTAESTRMSGLGANVNEAWYSMAGSFYSSQEYAQANRDDAGFVTDLYNTFFNRAPDAAGLGFWVAQLVGRVPREVVLVSFMFSTEFLNFTQRLFGNTSARAEVDMVMDFYRGVLSRLPDDGGFSYWLGAFRSAQCQGASAVRAQAEAISQAFTSSGEYAGRARSNSQFVGDMYNAFLRRGGDPDGVRFWVNALDSGSMSRDDVRRSFVGSTEFTGRVSSVIDQGCAQ